MQFHQASGKGALTTNFSVTEALQHPSTTLAQNCKTTAGTHRANSGNEEAPEHYVQWSKPPPPCQGRLADCLQKHVDTTGVFY